MKPRIFITGATGFIGKNLVDELVLRKSRVICLIREKRQADMFKKSEYLRFIIGVLPDITAIAKEIKAGDIMVHLANISDGKTKNDFYRINVEGTRNLASLCEKIKIKKFIFLSSTVVLNNFKSPYSETKKLAESIVRGSKLNYIILTPDMVYGTGSKRHILDFVEDIRSKKLKVIFGYGGIKIQPVYVKDVVSSIIKATEKAIKRKAYNIASEKPITYKQLFKLIRKITKSRCVILPIPKFFALPIARLYALTNKNSTLYEWIRSNERRQDYSISNAKKDLDFSPVPIENGLRIVIKS